MSKTFNIKRRENAPDFVIGSFGFKLEDIEQFQNAKGYINFDILENKKGEQYIKVNEYGLKTDKEPTAEEELPF